MSRLNDAEGFILECKIGEGYETHLFDDNSHRLYILDAFRRRAPWLVFFLMAMRFEVKRGVS